MRSKHFLCLCLLVISCLPVVSLAPVSAQKPPKPPKLEPTEKLDREQVMVLNLNRGRNSSGFYVTESMRQIRFIEHDIEKARHQLEQVDRNYARYKGHPDDKYLQGPEKQLQLAEQTANQLKVQLDDAYAQLKDAVKDALVAE